MSYQVEQKDWTVCCLMGCYFEIRCECPPLAVLNQTGLLYQTGASGLNCWLMSSLERCASVIIT